MLQRPSSINQLKECLDRFKLMRASQPVSYDEAMQSWHLVCYQEVLQVLAGAFTANARFSMLANGSFLLGMIVTLVVWRQVQAH